MPVERRELGPRGGDDCGVGAGEGGLGRRADSDAAIEAGDCLDQGVVGRDAGALLEQSGGERERR